MHQYATLEDTVYFGFASNLTTGAAGDGATPTFQVRLAGASASAAPVLTGTPTLLTSASYVDGSYEVAVAATAANGFVAGNVYLVFAGLTISGVIPNACIGTFKLSAVPIAAADIRAAVGLANPDLDTQLAGVPAAVWAYVVTGTTTAVQAMRGFIAAMLGKASGLNANTPKYRNIADTKDVISATTDANGNRTAVTLDLS